MNLEIWVFSTHSGGQARTGLLDTFGNLLRSLRSVGTHAELTHAAIWLNATAPIPATQLMGRHLILGYYTRCLLG